ncbi:MAG TPA: alpha/beta hydrolase, partial [Candidatus Nanopelagicales bacterium]|nr:alpha/beta hydrolase [Candidatus Nanopelagicales bacterium]
MADSPTTDLETEYLTPAMMRDFRPSVEAWARDARAYRDAVGARAELDVAYGDGARRRLDIFPPDGSPSRPGPPIALFIHGGYWQYMDRSSFSHMARGLNAHGVTTIIAGYTLCPETTLAGIVDDLRRAVAFVAKRFGAPVTVFGHSAGGHLTACLLATDWASIDAALGPHTVPAGMPISGLFDLEPLLATSLNKNLRLDPAEARRLSP